MSNLIDGLLGLSRVTRREMKLKTVDLSTMAGSIVADLQKSDPDRQVKIEIAEMLVAHNSDESLLRVALENLLGNAWKFTSREANTRIEVGMTMTEDGPEYFVRDNGAGFNMAHAGKLFGAFDRLHRVDEFEGDGIGLATVQRIIQRHGGRIWAEGEVGEGATFFFTL